MRRCGDHPWSGVSAVNVSVVVWTPPVGRASTQCFTDICCVGLKNLHVPVVVGLADCLP